MLKYCGQSFEPSSTDARMFRFFCVVLLSLKRPCDGIFSCPRNPSKCLERFSFSKFWGEIILLRCQNLNSKPAASNDITDELKTNYHDLIEVLSWTDWGKSRKTSVRISGVPAETETSTLRMRICYIIAVLTRSIVSAFILNQTDEAKRVIPWGTKRINPLQSFTCDSWPLKWLSSLEHSYFPHNA